MSPETPTNEPPEVKRCPNCKRDTLVYARIIKRALTGVITSLYFCPNCKANVDIRWAPDRPGKYDIVNLKVPVDRSKAKRTRGKYH